jgi:hypothetical protein
MSINIVHTNGRPVPLVYKIDRTSVATDVGVNMKVNSLV